MNGVEVPFVVDLIRGLLVKEGVKEEHAERISKTIGRILEAR